MADFELNPVINVEDFEGKPFTGKYISHQRAGRDLANVVLERSNGTRFRVVTTLEDIEDSLAVARGD